MFDICDGETRAAFNPDPEITKKALSQFDGLSPKKAKVRKRPRRTDIITQNGVFKSSIDPAWLWPRKILCVEAKYLRDVPADIIAQVLGVDRSTIYRWLSRYADETAVLHDRRRAHGPRVKNAGRSSGVESKPPVQERPSGETGAPATGEGGPV